VRRSQDVEKQFETASLIVCIGGEDTRVVTGAFNAIRSKDKREVCDFHVGDLTAHDEWRRKDRRGEGR
jgi:TPP-dependent 2-oxoacid decarboxylase